MTESADESARKNIAYDKAYFSIRPSYEIEVRRGILDERDGPVLQHGSKEIYGREIIVPRKRGDRPEAWRLEERYGRFRDMAR